VEALVKEFHQKYPKQANDPRTNARGLTLYAFVFEWLCRLQTPESAGFCQPAPIDGPIHDVPAILERSPSPLELERRSPAPLLARAVNWGDWAAVGIVPFQRSPYVAVVGFGEAAYG
jgi:hypothetical protein